MSRCFPYPPPGYVRSDSRRATLIESIKWQNEKSKSEPKKERKRQRKDRKEKRERKKGKCFHISDDSVKKLSGDELSQLEKSRYDLNSGFISKRKEEAAEQLESSLSEEHGMPFSSQSICYLSDDGIQSSKKRKASCEGTDHLGNIVRIKMALRKSKEPNSMVSGEQSCTTSGRADSQYGEDTCPLDKKQWFSAEGSVDRPDNEKCRSSLVEVPGLHMGSKSYQSEMHKTESLYRELIQEWLPPPIQLEQESLCDQEWPSGVRRQNVKGSKRIAACLDVARCSPPLPLWPRAHYMPEAHLFAMPFAVPF